MPVLFIWCSEDSIAEKVLVPSQSGPSIQAATGWGSGIPSLSPPGFLGRLGKVWGVGVLYGVPDGSLDGPIKCPTKARHGLPGEAGPYGEDEVYMYMRGVARKGDGARGVSSVKLLGD